MRYTNLPSESQEYAAAREALRVAEFELMRQLEEVAKLRRQLPSGPVLDDYTFLEGSSDAHAADAEVHERRLADLFSGSDRPLIVYHLMYGKAQTDPCPMCTMWVDGFNAIAPHLNQNADLAIVAASSIAALREHGRRRAWNNLRLLSAGSSTFKLDLGSEDEEGNQDSRVSVFTKGRDGAVRHFYTGSPHLDERAHERGIDLLCPTWHLLDLTPQGRGDWYSSLSYD
jgi:predicted dithiol-disulfide oxidoreductase (DUF899 family)